MFEAKTYCEIYILLKLVVMTFTWVKSYITGEQFLNQDTQIGWLIECVQNPGHMTPEVMKVVTASVLLAAGMLPLSHDLHFQFSMIVSQPLSLTPSPTLQQPHTCLLGKEWKLMGKLFLLQLLFCLLLVILFLFR